MKMTKRVLSIVLTLAMLLTVAVFPTTVNASPGKAIVLEASLGGVRDIVRAGPLFLARPSDVAVVGDYLTLPEEGLQIKLPTYSRAAKVLHLVNDTSNSDTTLQITGFIVEYGRNGYRLNNNKVYVKVSESGLMTGFYTDATFTTPVTISLNEAGWWVFSWQKYLDGTGTEQALTTNSNYNFDSNTNSMRWALEVKETRNDVSAPSLSVYNISASGDILSSIKTGVPSSFDKTTQNVAYLEDIVPNGKTSDASYCSGGSDNYTIAEENVASTVREPTSAFRIDFTQTSYVDSITLGRTGVWNAFTLVYDVYGSENGEDWYLIGEAGKTVSCPNGNANTDSVEFEIGGIAKNFRIYFRDTSWGIGNSTATVQAITGQIGVEKIAVKVLSGADQTTELFVGNLNNNGTLVVADEYKDYDFFSDSACENEINISTEVFTANTTVYAKERVTAGYPTITIVDSENNDKVLYTYDTGESNKLDTTNADLLNILVKYDVYEAGLQTKADLSVAFESDTTFYAVKKTSSSTGAYVPKTVEFIKNPVASSTKVNTHRSNMPIILPDVDIYVGDTIKFPDNFFTDNTFTYNTTTLGSMAVTIQKYDDGTNSWSKTIYSQSETSYKATLEHAGIYVILPKQYKDTEDTQLAWNENFRYGIFEVKDPNAEVTAKTTPSLNTSGTIGTLTLTGASVRHMNFSDYTATQPLSASFLGADVAGVKQYSSSTGAFPAGTVLDLMYTLESVSYVESVSWTESSGNLIYSADVYGSLDGENWYLLGDDVESGIGKAATWKSSTGTVAVNGVAKYVKLANIVFKGSSYSDVSAAAATGYTLETTDYEETPDAKIILPDGTAVDLADEYVKTKEETLNGVDVSVEYPNLPVAHSVGTDNYIVTGWNMSYSDGTTKPVSLVTLKETPVALLGNLYPEVQAITSVTKNDLTAGFTPLGEDVNKFSKTEFINGLYLQGTQIRVPAENAWSAEDTNTNGGLRFVTAVDNNLWVKLEGLVADGTITNLDKGTLAVTERYYNKGTDLRVENAKNDGTLIKVAGTMTYKTDAEFKADEGDTAGQYYKYTACIINIPSTHFNTTVYVRPYIQFTYSASGETVTLYGEQYGTSIAAASKLAIVDYSNETSNEYKYLDYVLTKAGIAH